MTANQPFPESRARHRRPFALACTASLLFHGGLLTAAHWGWQSASPVRVPPMVAIPVINAAHLESPDRPHTSPAPASPIVAKAPAPEKESVRTDTSTVPARLQPLRAKAEGQAKAKPEPMPPKTARAPTPQAWTLNPPVPPRRPIALAGLGPAPPMAPPPAPKPGTPKPARNAPVLVKTAPVTAPRNHVAKPSPASSATTGTAKPSPARTRPSAAGLGNPPPAYPWISRNRGEEGRVILDVEVTPEGRAQEVRIKQSSGSKRLDSAARAAVQGWRFAPARRAGLAVPGRIDVPITFRLTD